MESQEWGSEAQKGCLIAFEGIDGSGKSTQIQLLAQRLRKHGAECEVTMEPSDGPIGSLIRQMLIGRMRTDNRAIAAMFAADRLDHLLNEIDGIAGRVAAGKTVLTDRYYFSNYAYQAVDLPMEWVMQLNEPSSAVLKPAVNVFLDIDENVAMERIRRNRSRQELFEKKERLTKVRKNYFEAFRLLEGRETVVIVDGTQEPEQIAAQVWEQVKPYLPLSK